MKTFYSKQDVLNRLKEAYNIQKDIDLAELLGISKSTLSNWVSRDSLDYDRVFSKCEHINIDWLLTGRGNMLKSEGMSPIGEQAPAPTPQPTAETAIYYNMYKEEKAENKELMEQIGALKQQIKTLEEKIAELQLSPLPNVASVGSTRIRKSDAVDLGDVQFVGQ